MKWNRSIVFLSAILILLLVQTVGIEKAQAIGGNLIRNKVYICAGILKALHKIDIKNSDTQEALSALSDFAKMSNLKITGIESWPSFGPLRASSINLDDNQKLRVAKRLHGIEILSRENEDPQKWTKTTGRVFTGDLVTTFLKASRLYEKQFSKDEGFISPINFYGLAGYLAGSGLYHLPEVLQGSNFIRSGSGLEAGALVAASLYVGIGSLVNGYGGLSFVPTVEKTIERVIKQGPGSWYFDSSTLEMGQKTFTLAWHGVDESDDSAIKRDALIRGQVAPIRRLINYVPMFVKLDRLIYLDTESHLKMVIFVTHSPYKIEEFE